MGIIDWFTKGNPLALEQIEENLTNNLFAQTRQTIDFVIWWAGHYDPATLAEKIGVFSREFNHENLEKLRSLVIIIERELPVLEERERESLKAVEKIAEIGQEIFRLSAKLQENLRNLGGDTPTTSQRQELERKKNELLWKLRELSDILKALLALEKETRKLIKANQ